jgi:hypothetical protein
VGEKIGVSADSARMRVDRAIEKLRKNLAKRGVVSSTGALAAVITAQSITAAPVGLAAAVSSSAVTSAATAGAAATFFQFMAITKLQAGAIAVAVAALTVPIVMQRQTNQQLEQSNQALVRQKSDAAAEIEPLKKEITRLNGMVAQNATKANSSNELYQLRAEVARLREEAKHTARTRAIVAATDGGDPVHEELRAMGLRVEKLKENLARHPESQIPELALLEQKDWLNAVSWVKSLETEEEVRDALNSLRFQGKLKAGVDLQQAMKRYAAANDDAVPKDVSDLQPYLDKPFDGAILERYKIVYSGKYSDVTDEQDLLIDVAPVVDNEHDSKVAIRRNGSTSRTFSQVSETIEQATKQYADANNGMLPQNPSELSGLVPPTIDAQRIQKFLAKIPTNMTTWAQYRAVRQ